MLCKHYPERDSDSPPQKFKLYSEKESVKVNLKMFGQIVSIGGINATQFPVNSNIATTGHKLQGMTKDNLIVQSWNYPLKIRYMLFYPEFAHSQDFPMKKIG